MKEQDTEPNMCEIICQYIIGNGQKLYQDDPHLPMRISSAEKPQDRTGWDNMMQGWISRHWNHWKSDYLKKEHPVRQG